jgi:hypothetical protein
MSSAQERNIRFYEAGYLNALKKGLLEEKSSQVQDHYYEYNNTSSSSSDDEKIQTRSRTTRKTERTQRRNERNAARNQRQTATATNTKTNATKQQTIDAPAAASVETNQKKLTKRQQVLQRYAEQEAAGVASVLASMADAAITRSQLRNQNKVMWTEKDRAAASRAADIALEVATFAAEAAQGKKKKEQPAPYWTRLHEKNRSDVRFQKEIGRVFECDFY